jgi:hypothetical protein
MGASGSSQTVSARNKTQLERKLNMQWLAQSFHSLMPKIYLERAIIIMDKDM